MNIKKCRMNEFINEIGDKKVVCFGFGIRARSMCENYKEVLEHIEFFVDNDTKKHGIKKICNKEVKVVSAEEFLSLKSYDNIVMIITTQFFNEIIEQFKDYPRLKDVDTYSYLLMEDLEEVYEANSCEVEKVADVKIPKVIHYCWFGRGKKSNLHEMCIKSWKEKCSDYEIIEWNEDNFDINMNTYIKQAYKSGKYAFVSDVARLYALYNYGGIYMDTDVEVIKSLDELLYVEGFLGFENKYYISSGMMGATKGNKWVKDQLDSYEEATFLDEKGEPTLFTNVERVTKVSKEKHNLITNGDKQILKYGVVVYPRAYFFPKSIITGELTISKNTYTIHHYDSSWFPDDFKKRTEKLQKYARGI